MFRRLSFAFLLIWAGILEVQAVPRVLVSIKPIHSLVAAVMEGAGKPELLVTDTSTSPHSYALRPSDALKLDQAEIVFWVGESYEIFLKNRLEGVPHNVTVVKLAESPDLNLYPMRQGGFWGVEPHCACECQQHFGGEEDHDHDHEDAKGAYAVDGHLWLAPNNARAIVAHVAKVLADKDPINAPLYMANAEKMYDQLNDLAQDLAEMLEPVKGVHYLLVHDFMQYFDRFFGTEAVGVIRIHPEIEPSMAHMVQVQKRLVEQRIAHCLFAEPQFDQKRLKKMAESAKVHFGVLDYLGGDLEPGPSCYFEIMRRLGVSLVKSLSKPQISGVQEMLAAPHVILNPAQ